MYEVAEGLADVVYHCLPHTQSGIVTALVATALFGAQCMAFQLAAAYSSAAMPFVFAPLLSHRAVLLVFDAMAAYRSTTVVSSRDPLSWRLVFSLLDHVACAVCCVLLLTYNLAARDEGRASAAVPIMASLIPLALSALIQLVLLLVCCCSSTGRWPTWMALVGPRALVLLVNALLLCAAWAIDGAPFGWTSLFTAVVITSLLVLLAVVGVLTGAVIHVMAIAEGVRRPPPGAAAAASLVASPQEAHSVLNTLRVATVGLAAFAAVTAALIRQAWIDALTLGSTQPASGSGTLIAWIATTTVGVFAVWCLLTSTLAWVPGREPPAPPTPGSTTSAASITPHGLHVDVGPALPKPRRLVKLAYHRYRRLAPDDDEAALRVQPPPPPFTPAHGGSAAAVAAAGKLEEAAPSPNAASVVVVREPIGVDAPAVTSATAVTCSTAESDTSGAADSAATRPALRVVATVAARRPAASPLAFASPAAHNTCSICFAAPADAVLMECGHGNLCLQCGSTIAAEGVKRARVCPFCRASIAHVVRIPPPHRHTARLVLCVVDSDDDGGGGGGGGAKARGSTAPLAPASEAAVSGDGGGRDDGAASSMPAVDGSNGTSVAIAAAAAHAPRVSAVPLLPSEE